MVDATRLENGDLLITAKPDEIEEIRDNLESRGFWSALSDAFEGYSCNGSYTPFDAGQGNPFVGLTDAPCIAEWLNVEDDSTITLDGDFWFYGNYAITCPLEELCENGKVVFTLAR